MPEGSSLKLPGSPLPTRTHSRWQAAVPDRRSSSARRESRLISAGKPTWELGAKSTEQQISQRKPMGLALSVSTGAEQAIPGFVATQQQQGKRWSWEENPPPITERHPSLYARASQRLGLFWRVQIPGKNTLQNSSLQLKALPGSFCFLLHIYSKHLSEDPLAELARSRKSQPPRDTPFPVVDNPEEDITFLHTCQPAWEMRNCSQSQAQGKAALVKLR